MKKILIFFIVILIIVLTFIGYKSYLLHNYRTNYIAIDTGSEIKLNLKNKQANNVIIQNLSLYLDPNSYMANEQKDSYIKSSSNENTEVSRKSQISLKVINNVIQNICREDNKLELVGYANLINETSPNNEIDLIKNYINNSQQKLTVFSSSKSIKSNYLSQKFIEHINVSGQINFLNGLNGYLYKNKNKTDVVIFYNNNMYTISFTKDFTEDEIIDIINTIKFI